MGAAPREKYRSPDNPRVPDGPPEVLILGSGPAGCAAAYLLSRWGHRAVLQTKPTVPAAILGESIPPSTRKLFDVIGLTAEMEAASFIRSTGNTVWWGGGSARVELFASGERGWQVTREHLESILAAHVAHEGLTMTRSRAEAARIDTSRHVFTLDCTGRAGVLARARRLRIADPGRRTVALTATWDVDTSFSLANPSHTVIESYEGGWAWSVPISAHQRVVAMMVDPATSGLARSVPARDVYLQELRRTSQMAALTSGAALADGPTGWDASMYHAARYVDDDILLVGDAASFIDPISSAGVKKALASGWLAAVAVHTSLRRPAMRDVALAFYAAREAEVFASLRAMTERVLADAAAGHAHPFWSDRTESGAADLDREEVAAAFERLRREATLHVQRNQELRIVQQPAVSGNEIVLEPRLVSPQRQHGVRYAFDVDLIALVDLAPAYASVPDLFEAYNRRHAPVALPDFVAALSTAIAHDWLVWV
jgi:flavin-dependent dehydrogenase